MYQTEGGDTRTRRNYKGGGKQTSFRTTNCGLMGVI